MWRWILGAVVLGLGVPAVASAHDEAKTPVSGSIILDMTKPAAPARERAFDESLRQAGPPPARPKVEPVVLQALHERLDAVHAGKDDEAERVKVTDRRV